MSQQRTPGARDRQARHNHSRTAGAKKTGTLHPPFPREIQTPFGTATNGDGLRLDEKTGKLRWEQPKKWLGVKGAETERASVKPRRVSPKADPQMWAKGEHLDHFEAQYGAETSGEE